jgi:hypothetical protein
MQHSSDLSTRSTYMGKESDNKVESYFMEPTPIYTQGFQQFIQDHQDQLRQHVAQHFGNEPDQSQHPAATMNVVNNMVYPEGRKRATKACIGCKQRHTRCGFERPCVRCTSLGFECIDPPSKKRGSKKNEHKNSIEKGQKMKGEMRVKPYVPELQIKSTLHQSRCKLHFTITTVQWTFIMDIVLIA